MLKILVVEDNRDLNMILVKRLEHEGYSVVSLEDGYALLSYVMGKEEPDAIVLDLMLPGRSGLELLNTIISKWKRVRIFIFSAHSEYEKRHMLKECNICAYICKSDGIDKLIEKIKLEFAGPDNNDES
jgi:two-component system, OmpR family, copper resistance phosphate regulon response regulator CusR